MNYQMVVYDTDGAFNRAQEVMTAGGWEVHTVLLPDGDTNGVWVLWQQRKRDR